MMDLQKRWMNILLVVEALLLILVLGLGVYKMYGPKADDRNTQINQEAEGRDQLGDDAADSEIDEKEEKDTTEAPNTAVTTREQFSEPVEAILAAMPLEMKVAQMFIVTPEAITGTSSVIVARNISQSAYETYPVGGLVFSTDNYQWDSQFVDLIAAFQGFSQQVTGVKLFVSANGFNDDTVSYGTNLELNQLTVARSLDASLIRSLRDFMEERELIMSGDLSSDGITTQYTPAEAAVAAVTAGVDLLYNPLSFTEAYKGIVDAVNNGQIDPILIDNAVGRILSTKQIIE